MRTETASKHPWALGQTGTAAPTTGGSTTPDLEAPEVSEWALTGTTVDGDASVIPALLFEGAVTDGTPVAVLFSYYQGEEPPVDEADWIFSGSASPSTTRHVVTSVGAGLSYVGSVQYVFGLGLSERLVLGPVVTGDLLSGGIGAELLTVGGEPLTLDGEFISEG